MIPAKRRRLLYTLALAGSTFFVSLLNFGLGTWHSAQNHPTSLHVSNITPIDALSLTRKQAQLPVLSFYREPQPRPPLESIVQGWNITGDPSWLLNFAITGFPKCGTSTLMFHLQNHPQVQIFGDERCEMCFNQHAKLIDDLYNKFPQGNFARGIKCPMDLENTKLSGNNYIQYFPHTDFIVGIRHPVLWFESFYNFRIHNEFPMPPADKLIGKCRRGYYNLCTFRSNFHIFLGNLGKTNFTTDPAEYQYVAPQFRRSMSPLQYDDSNNSSFADDDENLQQLSRRPARRRRIFLYEVSQLSGGDSRAANTTTTTTDAAADRRVAQFRVDLQHYLGLSQPIPPMIWFKPGRNHTSQDIHTRTATRKIDICDEPYVPLRQVLMEQAVNASRWIRKFFVESPDVVVSSRDYFVHTLMPSWERDPCLDRRAEK